MKGVISHGDKKKAVVVLIHGMGVNSEFFTDTHNTSILSGTVTLRYFISKGYSSGLDEILPEYKTTLWENLKKQGYNIMTWSQRFPLGSIMEAVKELKEIASLAQRIFPHSSLVLIGHSRGGLIARKFMEDTDTPVRALITLATPHQGSSLAKIGMYLSNFVNTTEQLIPSQALTTMHKIARGINNLLNSSGIEELYRDSHFLNQLHDRPHDNVKYMSIGATEPNFFPFFQWNHTNSFLNIFNSLSSGFLPEEILSGKGDGLVSEESSQMPWTSEHHALPGNHFSIVCHNKVLEYINKMLEEL